MTTLPKAMLFITLPVSPLHFRTGPEFIPTDHSRLSSRVPSTRKPSWVLPHSELLSTAALDQRLCWWSALEMPSLADLSSPTTRIMPHLSSLPQHLAQCLATVGTVTKMVPSLGALRIWTQCTFRRELYLRRFCVTYDPDPAQLELVNQAEHTCPTSGTYNPLACGGHTAGTDL